MTPRRFTNVALAAILASTVAGAATAGAQAAVARPAPAAPIAPAAPLAGPAVGSLAPDFTLPTSTRYGKLASPTRLADLKGQTVVIAFFYKARTKG